MRSILKYIFPIFLFALLWNGDESVAQTYEHNAVEDCAEYSADTSLPFSDAEPSVSATTTLLNCCTGVQNSSRRVDTGQRFAINFIKDGKFVDIDNAINFHNILKRKHYPLSEPYYRLISLGKLII